MSEPSVLIEPEELAQLLDQEPRPVLADVRWQLGGPSQRSAYEDAHLPGARWVDLESVLTAPPGEGGRHPLPPAAVFEDAMQQLGLDAGQLLVAYDSANSLAAARLWWLLTDSGHAEVRVLNGGLAAWQRAGLEIERGWVQPADRGSFRAVPGTRRQIDADEIEARLGARGTPLLVDVRAPERYSGATEPIDPIAGHIPRAINLPSTDNLDSDGRFLQASQIYERYTAAGTTEDTVLYCGSGITAAHSLLAMESAGLTATLYPGSWSDWISDPGRPVERA